MSDKAVTDALLETLNPAQREAVEHVHGPMLVLAGAGSGKTRVLTVRIARLIDEHGVPPDRIFAVTFTNKAANEMKQRIGRLLGRDPGGLWIGTFHSLSARMLRREADALGFTRQFTIYDEDGRLGLIKRLMEQRGTTASCSRPGRCRPSSRRRRTGCWAPKTCSKMRCTTGCPTWHPTSSPPSVRRSRRPMRWILTT